ncbi:MAG TPA: acyl-CoA reductase, partial [Elusimicrobiales bacterium]|nr:acyl-CoA reductase [Elusimicrobiales bacterium]
AFDKVQRIWPQGKLSPDEMVEITKTRELAKVDEAGERGACASSFPRTHWTVVAEHSPDFKASPLNRVLYVKPAASLEEIARQIRPYGRFLQTVGFCGLPEERQEAARLFGAAGAARITRLGKMLEAPPGSPHDGGFPMRELVNYVGIEGAAAPHEKLAALVAHARANSPYYKKRFAKFPPVRTAADFSRLPLLNKNDILANTPPESEDMFSAKPGNGIYFASGGSTGSPKYIFYEFNEYSDTTRRLARCFTGPGLTPMDRAANLFVAGNLWSSFISVEKALPHTGAISVPLSSTLPLPSLIKYLEEFRVTAIIGLPSFLLRVAEAVEQAKPRAKIPLR